MPPLWTPAAKPLPYARGECTSSTTLWKQLMHSHRLAVKRSHSHAVTQSFCLLIVPTVTLGQSLATAATAAPGGGYIQLARPSWPEGRGSRPWCLSSGYSTSVRSQFPHPYPHPHLPPRHAPTSPLCDPRTWLSCLAISAPLASTSFSSSATRSISE